MSGAGALSPVPDTSLPLRVPAPWHTETGGTGEEPIRGGHLVLEAAPRSPACSAAQRPGTGRGAHCPLHHLLRHALHYQARMISPDRCTTAGQAPIFAW